MRRQDPSNTSAPEGDARFELGAAKRLRILVDDAPDFIEILDSDGTIRYISPAITRVGGYLPAEVVGHHFKEFVHIDDLAKAMAALDRVLRIRELVQVTTRYRHKDGSWRIVENLGRNYLDDPEIRGIVVHTRDVTRHVQTELELEETEERYRSVVSAMAEGVVLQDLSGAIVTCNRSAEHILGLTIDQLRGVTSMDPRWQAIHEDGSPFPRGYSPGHGDAAHRRAAVRHNDGHSEAGRNAHLALHQHAADHQAGRIHTARGRRVVSRYHRAEARRRRLASFSQ
jgi:PAS domain S-box-containing protein